MLRSIRKMHGFNINAIDGEIGKVEGFLFDDHTWTIRYLVADTGNWLLDNLILISPVSILKPDWYKKNLPVDLTKDQVEKSPAIETNQPVSRQHEIDEEIQKIIKDMEKRSENILRSNRVKLDALAEALLENETLEKTQINWILDKVSDNGSNEKDSKIEELKSF